MALPIDDKGAGRNANHEIVGGAAGAIRTAAEMPLLGPPVVTMGQCDQAVDAGFGNDLLHSDSTGRPRFDNAYMDLVSGDFQE